MFDANAELFPADILILTDHEALEVSWVERRLEKEHGCVVCKLNVSRFPEYVPLALPMTNAGMFKVTWLHSADRLSTATLEGAEREVAQTESSAFLDSWMRSLRTTWLNSIENIAAAAKPLQFERVMALGIKVPPYITTNNPARAQQFCRDHGRCVVKGLRLGYLEYGSKAYKNYTQPIDAETPILQQLRGAPAIVQKRIYSKREIRVTVVGEHVYDISIRTADLPPDCADYRCMELKPDRFYAPASALEATKLSRMIAHEFRLKFCSIDWIESVDGELYFLEVNPCTSFGMYEKAGAGDISGQLARLLVSLIKK